MDQLEGGGGRGAGFAFPPVLVPFVPAPPRSSPPIEQRKGRTELRRQSPYEKSLIIGFCAVAIGIMAVSDLELRRRSATFTHVQRMATTTPPRSVPGFRDYDILQLLG